ncbi:MAG: hypothetical protein KDA41_03510 [Planctomycetales bacterium]|nr:hypothetical protein [Planctomycetales bacterium]
MNRFARCLACVVFCASAALADDAKLNELINDAKAASADGKAAQTVALLDQAIAIDAERADLYRWRGRELFSLGQIDASLRDFDRVATLAPDLEKTLWERGISYYYTGKFERGAKQFALYQTYHDADVENAAWRFICVARSDGLKHAQDSLLAIRNDSRIPMMAIYDMYRGEKSPDDVLAAANAGSPGEAELNTRLFYAHLYIGLYLEAQGKADDALKHLEEAKRRPIQHYMYDVARVHLERAAPQE